MIKSAELNQYISSRLYGYTNLDYVHWLCYKQGWEAASQEAIGDRAQQEDIINLLCPYKIDCQSKEQWFQGWRDHILER